MKPLKILEALRVLESEDSLDTIQIDLGDKEDMEIAKDILAKKSTDVEAETDEPVVDMKAEKEDDLKNSYEGNLIIQCNVCQSNLFHSPEGIEMDENDNVIIPENPNFDLECPYCNNREDFTVIGKVAPLSHHLDVSNEESGVFTIPAESGIEEVESGESGIDPTELVPLIKEELNEAKFEVPGGKIIDAKDEIEADHKAMEDEETAKIMMDIDKREGDGACTDYIERVDESKLNEESGSKPEIVEVKDKNTLDFLYKNWAMTWEGLDEKSFDEALKTCGGENAKGYLIKGEEMNRFYGLHGDNAYPNDLNIFAIYPFKGLAMQFGARWFTDIVDNNRRRERHARGMRESFYYLVSDKNGWLDKDSNFIIPKSSEDIKNIIRFDSQKEAEDKLKSLSKDIISKYQPSIDVLSEELKVDEIKIKELNENIDCDDAYKELDELDLDEEAYNYYKQALDEICIGDKLSIKNGHGYKSVEDVLEDARKTIELNKEEDLEEAKSEEKPSEFISELTRKANIFRKARKK